MQRKTDRKTVTIQVEKSTGQGTAHALDRLREKDETLKGKNVTTKKDTPGKSRDTTAWGESEPDALDRFQADADEKKRKTTAEVAPHQATRKLTTSTSGKGKDVDALDQLTKSKSYSGVKPLKRSESHLSAPGVTKLKTFESHPDDPSTRTPRAPRGEVPTADVESTPVSHKKRGR